MAYSATAKVVVYPRVSDQVMPGNEAYEVYDKKNPQQTPVKKAPPKRYRKG